MKDEILRNGKDLPESKCTHLVRNVEFARPVEIEDGVEGTRMSRENVIILRLISDKCQAAAPVEEELVVDEAVVRAERHDLLVRGGAGQQPQPRPRQLLQHPPQHLVPHPAHVQARYSGQWQYQVCPPARRCSDCEC